MPDETAYRLGYLAGHAAGVEAAASFCDWGAETVASVGAAAAGRTARVLADRIRKRDGIPSVVEACALAYAAEVMREQDATAERARRDEVARRERRHRRLRAAGRGIVVVLGAVRETVRGR